MIEFIKILLYYPFLNLLTFYVWLVPGHNVIWGIILLTLTVRFALLIPTKRQAQSQRKTMQLAPLIDDLKKEYGDDKQGLAVAQMELYKKNGINPFGSCALALIQLPILLILYYAILHGLKADSPHLYSWLPRPDMVQNTLFGLDLFKPDHTYILPILAAALQFLQMRLTLPKHDKNAVSTDPAIAMQRNTAYIFPLVTLYIARNFPAGVAVYWIVSTGFSVVQQYFVNQEKFKIQGVSQVMKEADKEHPEYHRSKKVEAEILEETATKKGVTVTVRKKSKN